MPGRSGTRNAKKEEKKEQWVVDIEKKYNSYNPGTYDEKKKMRYIYKWPNNLVAASSLSHHRAPRTVSLGPYYHGKEHLQPMEHHKERALHRILYRSKIPLSSFVQSLQDVEQELRDSYEDLDLQQSSDLFLRMMLFDGCFLLEVLRFRLGGWSLIAAFREDMLILENQIPLCVLEKLLAVEEGTKRKNNKYLYRLIAKFYGLSFPSDGPCVHILDVCRTCLIGDSTTLVEEKIPISVRSHFQLWLHLAAKGLKRVLIAMLIAIPFLVFWIFHGRIPKHGHFRTATRLHEAGIEFKKGKRGSGLTITFDEKNGVITLPYIQLSDSSAILYINLMAFERMHSPFSKNQKVTEYMALMDELIDTAEDVSVLCSQGIVRNLLASDDDAARLFNAFSAGLIVGVNAVSPSKQWQRYAASGWNLAIAYLKHNYFQNPWSVVSLLAAIVFLVLTIIQTVFSGMEALKNGK